MTALAPHLEAFLRDHLQRQRGASPHTCDSYAGSFRALLTFASARLHTAPSALTLEQLDADLVGAFLEQLDTIRHNGAATRNVRLAAIRAFFRFLQHREPAALEQIRRILAIPFKRRDTRLVPYLTTTEVQALVDAPAADTRSGIRDRAMLHLTICAGLRVSELTGLRLDDIAAQSVSIRIRGKGRRERALPLWKSTAAALRAWLAVWVCGEKFRTCMSSSMRRRREVMAGSRAKRPGPFQAVSPEPMGGFRSEIYNGGMTRTRARRSADRPTDSREAG